MNRAANVLGGLLALLIGAGLGAWQRAGGGGGVAQSGGAAGDASVITPALLEIVRDESRTTRSLQQYAAIEQASVADLPALLNLMRDDFSAVGLIARRWAKLDPRHMLQMLYADALRREDEPGGLPQRHWLQEILLEAWCKADPAAVIKALTDIPDFLGRQQMRRTVRMNLMKADPARALELMKTWDMGPARYQGFVSAELGAAQKWVDADPRRALEMAGRMDASELRNEMLKRIGKNLGDGDPAAGLAAVAGLPASARMTAGEELLRAWALRDSAAAAEYVASRTDAMERAALAEGLIDSWSRADPVAALAWSGEHLRGRAGADAAEKIVTTLAGTDLGAAVELVESMEAGAGQRRATKALFKTWLEKPDERSAALEWLAELPDEQLQRQAVAEVAPRWSALEAKSFRTFVAGPMGTLVPSQEVMMAGVRFAYEDQAGALAWAQQLDAPQRRPALEGAMTLWLKTKTEPAMAYAASLPPGPVREEAVQAVAQYWVERDPAGQDAGAAKWFGSLTEAELEKLRARLEKPKLGMKGP